MASAGLGSAYRQLRALFGGGSVVALEDGQLLARFAADRDEAAFEALIARHGPMVLTICRAVLRNEHDVEDAFQATFLVLARKAGSIRGGDALGGWLHRVAYRASVQAGSEAARRRRKEAEAQAMAAQTAPKSEPDRDLQALLHEEIDRLPESQRLPVVLCDLEGLTYEQAASQLRWSVPTLRNRLARGRQTLRSRLTRRGLMAGAITGLMASKASAAVPLGLARITLAGAMTGGAGSTTAAVLAQTLVKGMFMTKLKIASTVGIAALTLASVALIAAGSGKTRDEPKPSPKPAARPEVVVQEPQKPGDPDEVRGIVVDPAGKPVAGATIRGEAAWPDPAPEAKSGPDGRYTIKLAPLRSNLPTEFQWGSRTLIASAPGFGMEVVWFNARPARPADVTIQLVQEGPAIEGRLLDLEGKPVAGARVQVESVWGPIRGTIDAWLASLKNPQPNVGPWLGLRGVATPLEVATGADGRFRVSGIGRDRVVILRVSGPKIATTTVHAVTQEMKGTHKVVQAGQPPYFTCYGPKFDLSIPPGRVIEGVIRDKETGKPIEGLRVYASINELAEAMAAGREGARTDAQGRYRLTGVGVSKTYTIFVQPTLGLPYLAGKQGLAETPLTTEPIEFDFKMTRGVVVRGRITDKVTGLPVPGRVTAFTVWNNPELVNADGFTDYSGYTAGPVPSAHNRPDGTYEVVTVPGRGIIGFQSEKPAYRVGFGGEKIPGFDPTYKMVFRTWPQPCSPGDYHVLAEVNLDPKAESATLDLQVDPGRLLKTHVVDPEGRPIDGLTAEGTTDMGQYQPVKVTGSTVDVSGLDPSRPRRVTVFHQERKLVGSLWLKGDEVDSPTIPLQPWGTIVGRVVDDQGEPLSRDILSGNINMAIDKPEEYGTFPGGVVGTGVPGQKDGRFRIEGLVPGLKYAGCTVNGQRKGRVMGDLFQDVTVTPGEVKDLGDLKILPWKGEVKDPGDLKTLPRKP